MRMDVCLILRNVDQLLAQNTLQFIYSYPLESESKHAAAFELGIISFPIYE